MKIDMYVCMHTWICVCSPEIVFHIWAKLTKDIVDITLAKFLISSDWHIMVHFDSYPWRVHKIDCSGILFV